MNMNFLSASSKPHLGVNDYAKFEKVYTRPDGHIEVFYGKADDRSVIVKIAKEDWAKDTLKKEACVLDQLDGSEHAPRLYLSEYSERNKKQVLAMEYIDGQNLKESLGIDNRWDIEPLDPGSATAVITGIAETEEDFLSRGVLYRDVNLDHIIIKQDGKVAFIDFGAALTDSFIDGRDGKGKWQHDGQPGTWELMAPEEFNTSSKLDETVAVYRLGVIYHLLLTGRLPVPRFNKIEQAKRWANEPTFNISSGLSSEQQRLFENVFQKDPALRTQSVGDFLDDLKMIELKSGRKPFSRGTLKLAEWQK